MVSKLKKIHSLLRRLTLKFLITVGIPVRAQVRVANKNIIFHNAKDSSLVEQIALHGVGGHEYELGQLIQSYPFEFKTFIDAGANIGFYSVLSRCAFGSKIDVAAIEAFPNNIQYMEDLKKNNDIEFDIFPNALAEISGEDREFYVPLTHRSSKLPPAASLVNNFEGTSAIYNSDKFKTIQVKTVSLSDVLAHYQPPYLVKIDIEGYELPVLQSIKEELKNRDDIDMIVEIMINDSDKTDIFDLLVECGYRGYLITNAGLVAEDRPLTLPYYNRHQKKQRTCWKNHYFTKKPEEQIKELSIEQFGYFV